MRYYQFVDTSGVTCTIPVTRILGVYYYKRPGGSHVVELEHEGFRSSYIRQCYCGNDELVAKRTYFSILDILAEA